MLPHRARRGPYACPLHFLLLLHFFSPCTAHCYHALLACARGTLAHAGAAPSRLRAYKAVALRYYAPRAHGWWRHLFARAKNSRIPTPRTVPPRCTDTRRPRRDVSAARCGALAGEHDARRLPRATAHRIRHVLAWHTPTLRSGWTKHTPARTCRAARCDGSRTVKYASPCLLPHTRTHRNTTTRLHRTRQGHTHGRTDAAFTLLPPPPSCSVYMPVFSDPTPPPRTRHRAHTHTFSYTPAIHYAIPPPPTTCPPPHPPLSRLTNSRRDGDVAAPPPPRCWLRTCGLDNVDSPHHTHTHTPPHHCRRRHYRSRMALNSGRRAGVHSPLTRQPCTNTAW